jgi:hypothetical protein
LKRRTQTAAAAALLVTAVAIGAITQRSCAPKQAPPRVAESAAPAPPTPPAAGAIDFMEVGHHELDELRAELGLAELEPSLLEVPITRRTLHYVRFYSEDERGRRWFEQLYRRSGAYRTTIEDALRQARLPLDLLWLVAAESSFDPGATSSAQAVGLWQLIPAVGAARGLRIDDSIDERRSPERSSRAATEHLGMLVGQFGTTDLVLAAYNAGSGRIERAVDELRARRRERGQAPQRVGFAHLAQEGLLPRETAEYVPRIAAMAIVGANLPRLGFAHIKPEPELRATPIIVEAETRLSTVARAAGITVGELRKLNPDLLMDAVPPDGERSVLVPAHRYNRALAVLPVFADEDAAAADDLPAEEEVATPAAPAPDLPALVAADYELVKTRIQLAKLLIDVPGSSQASLLGDFGAFAMPVGPQPQQQLRHKKVLWVTGDGTGGAHLGDARLEAQVSALLVPEATEEAVGSGITLRLERNPTATRVTITVQFRGGEPVEVDPPLSTTMVHQTQGDLRYVDAVRPSELDVGLLLAAGRLALLYDQARMRPAAALRARLVRHRRLALEKATSGRAWLTLGDLIFHASHRAFGRILQPRGPDAQTIRDRALLHEMPSMRMPGHATLTIAGNFETEQAREGAAFAISSVGLGIRGRERHDTTAKAPDHRGEVEAEHVDPLLLFAHELPALDAPGHAACLVVLEIAAGKTKSRLVRELVAAKLASSVSTHVDPDWSGSVGTIVVLPLDSAHHLRIEEHIDEALTGLATEGPTAVELAYATAMLASRLNKRLERIHKESGTLVPGKSFTSGARMLEALRPGYHERLLTRIRAVDAKAVKRAARTHYRSQERYIVVQQRGHLDGSMAAAP